MPGWSKPDSLIRTAAKKAGLIDLLGEDLYSILESGKAEKDMPLGVTSKLDLREQNINFQKKLGEDLMLDLGINKRSPYGGHRDSFSLGITKKF
tara:strand:+ start:325 stop:606 length:282 start_codon:yes stop_codon:yes gene_type:complete